MQREADLVQYSNERVLWTKQSGETEKISILRWRVSSSLFFLDEILELKCWDDECSNGVDPVSLERNADYRTNYLALKFASSSSYSKFQSLESSSSRRFSSVEHRYIWVDLQPTSNEQRSTACSITFGRKTILRCQKAVDRYIKNSFSLFERFQLRMGISEKSFESSSISLYQTDRLSSREFHIFSSSSSLVESVGFHRCSRFGMFVYSSSSNFADRCRTNRRRIDRTILIDPCRNKFDRFVLSFMFYLFESKKINRRRRTNERIWGRMEKSSNEKPARRRRKFFD